MAFFFAWDFYVLFSVLSKVLIKFYYILSYYLLKVLLIIAQIRNHQTSLRYSGRKMSGPGAKRGNGGAPSTVTTVSAHDATQKADLASNFECPVCFEYALPPIYQVRVL